MTSHPIPKISMLIKKTKRFAFTDPSKKRMTTMTAKKTKSVTPEAQSRQIGDGDRVRNQCIHKLGNLKIGKNTDSTLVKKE